MRTYVAVEDIQQAVEKAEGHAATIAYPPTRQGQRGDLCDRDPGRRATRTLATPSEATLALSIGIIDGRSM
jgi:hypothetical protein